LFNAEQAEGEAAERFQAVALPETTQPDYEPADELILATGAELHFGGDLAFYRRPTPEGTWPNHTDGDFIGVPHKSCFVNGAFYNTLLHELGHNAACRIMPRRMRNS
jgi:antirestriction protein ArdC